MTTKLLRHKTCGEYVAVDDNIKKRSIYINHSDVKKIKDGEIGLDEISLDDDFDDGEFADWEMVQ